MAEEAQTNTAPSFTDVNTFGGCPTCNGPLSVRTTPHETWSYCRDCRRLSKTKVAVTPAGFLLLHPAGTA